MRILIVTLIVSFYVSLACAKSCDSSQALFNAYLDFLKQGDFEAFRTLQWYDKKDTWIQDRLKSSALTHPLLFNKTLKEKERFNKIPLSVLKKKFAEIIKTIPKDLDWKTLKIQHQNDCTSKSKWKCAMQFSVTSNQKTLTSHIRIMRFEQAYFLDQNVLYVSVKDKEKMLVANTAMAKGEQLYKRIGCVACHSTQKNQRKIGPSLYKFYGSSIQASNGESKKVDEAHLRASILQPKKFLMKGYPPAMPSYQGRINEQDMNALITYLKSL